MLPQNIRQKLLNASEDVIDKMIEDAKGKDPLRVAEANRAVDTIKKFAIDAAASSFDIQKIELKNTTTVLDLLSKGSIGIDDALKLMLILQKKEEIDTVPQLLEKLEQLHK